MNVTLQITAEQINEALSAAVAQSVIAEAIQAEIERVIKSMVGYDGVIRKAVETETQRVIVDVIRTQCADQIRAVVVAALTDQLVGDITGKALDRLLRDLGRQ